MAEERLTNLGDVAQRLLVQASAGPDAGMNEHEVPVALRERQAFEEVLVARGQRLGERVAESALIDRSLSDMASGSTP
jgi:hypothetical protein